MAQLKRWESPRREGRNDKGRGGSARRRQKQKQMKALRQKLKSSDPKPLNPADASSSPSAAKSNPPSGKSLQPLPFYFLNPLFLITVQTPKLAALPLSPITQLYSQPNQKLGSANSHPLSFRLP